MKRLFTLGIALALAVMLVGCNSRTAQPKPPATAPTTTTSASTPASKPTPSVTAPTTAAVKVPKLTRVHEAAPAPYPAPTVKVGKAVVPWYNTRNFRLIATQLLADNMPLQAVGASLAVMWMQSGLNPSIVQGHTTASRPSRTDRGYGLLQWTGKPSQAGLTALASALGLPPNDINVQTWYYISEIAIATGKHPSVLSQIEAARTAAKAAAILDKNYLHIDTYSSGYKAQEGALASQAASQILASVLGH